MYRAAVMEQWEGFLEAARHTGIKAVTAVARLTVRLSGLMAGCPIGRRMPMELLAIMIMAPGAQAKSRVGRVQHRPGVGAGGLLVSQSVRTAAAIVRNGVPMMKRGTAKGVQAAAPEQGGLAREAHARERRRHSRRPLCARTASSAARRHCSALVGRLVGPGSRWLCPGRRGSLRCAQRMVSRQARASRRSVPLAAQCTSA